MKQIIKLSFSVFILSLLIIFGCGNKNKETKTDKDTATVTDIDGNVYKTVKIGTQEWMAENLKVSRYRNGDSIPVVESVSNWRSLDKGAYCVYDNKYSNSSKYGFLYNWYAVNDPRGLAPIGWHIPTDAEWQTLIDTLGGNNDAGGKLKDTAVWESPNEGAKNSIGFTALPGGFRGLMGYFDYAGENGLFWSNSENSRDNAWFRLLGCNYSHVRRHDENKKNGFSVRCVRDY